MTYAFMTYSCPDLDLDGVLATARRYGYQGIEPRLSANHQHGIETTTSPTERKAIREQAAAAGIDLCCIATSCKYADPETRESMVAETHQALDLAGDVGCRRIRVFGGVIPEGISREQAIEGVAEALESVAEHASQRGVTVCVETHDHWCDPADVVALMQAVDHPAIAVNWDVMHPVRMHKATMQEAFKALKPWIRHVHVHDGLTRHDKLTMMPMGEGEIDHRCAVRCLLSMDYAGYLSGEWIRWKPAEEHLAQELATLKTYEQDLHD